MQNSNGVKSRENILVTRATALEFKRVARKESADKIVAILKSVYLQGFSDGNLNYDPDDSDRAIRVRKDMVYEIVCPFCEGKMNLDINSLIKTEEGCDE